MATTYTSNCKLGKPALADLNWGMPLSANCDQLESFAPLSGLAVTPTEIPSTTLNVAVAAGRYRKGSGVLATYAGLASQAIPAGTAQVLYLDSTGALQMATAYPTTGAYTPLAMVAAGTGTITTITDQRISACELRASLKAAANDAAAATAGVLVGEFYQDTTGIVRVRLT